MGATRVLVIDDEEMIRNLLCRRLTAAGYEAIGAENGRVGLRLLQSTPMDAVVVDIVMPDSDGLEVLGQLRREAATVAIIAMSGGDGLYLDMALALGASRTFSKPFDPKALVQAVHELTSPRRGGEEGA